MAFPPSAEPKSALGYSRILSPTAGVRVSPLCLGAMNFGDSWKEWLGSCDKKTVFEILDYFYDNGGNFIDTSNNYQAEESETWIGEWMAERKNRDQIVLATKYTTFYPSGKNNEKIRVNFQGNHAKSLRVSVEASLKKLQTDYIDLLYVHWWDHTTSVPEVMQSLNNLVRAGKVLYLGISDTPAWIVSKANEYARQNGMAQFVVYQGRWSAGDRDFERDILPMVRAEGMALAPWGALGGGRFKSEAQRKALEGEGRKVGNMSENDIKITTKLEELAKKKNTEITSVALAYVMHKAPYVFPIVGGRKLEHIKGNIAALSVELTDEEIDEIEGAVPFDIGFPNNMMWGMFDPNFKYSTRLGSGDITLVKAAGHIQDVPQQRPIPAHKK